MKYSKTHTVCCAILCIIFIGIFVHWLSKNAGVELFSQNQFNNNIKLNEISDYVNGSEDMRTQLQEIHQKLTKYKQNSEYGTHSINVKATEGDKFDVSISCDNEILQTYPVGKPGPPGPVGMTGGPGPVGSVGQTGPVGMPGLSLGLTY
jgi:hypothetical protein